MPTLVRTVERLFAALLILPMFNAAIAQGKGDLSPELIYSHSKGSVVTILTFDSNKAALGQGSGFVVANNRIITNYHVLAGSSSASVIFNDGSIVVAKSVVAASQPKDIVIFEAETGNRPSLPLGDELQLKVGQAVYAIGAPQGLTASLSNGLVSSFRQDEGQFLIQITASISPGSSGGPLFNSQGLIVGITTSRLKDGSFGFAVGVGDIQHLLMVPLPVAIQLSDLTGDQAAPDGDLDTAQALFDKKQYANALTSFQKLSSPTKNSFDAQVLLCRIENQIPDYSLAIRACDAAINLQPTNGIPYGLKAYALLFSGDSESAEASALKADASFQSLLGLIYYSEGKYSLVPAQLSVDSDDPFELTLLEGAALRTGNTDLYHRLNAKLTTLKGPNNGWTLFANGSAAERDLNFQVALDDYRKCDADEDFIDPLCAIKVASVETRNGDISAAKSDMDSVLKRYPSNREVVSQAMFIDFLTGETDEAKRLHVTFETLTQDTKDNFTECLYYYSVNQPSLAVDPCNAMLDANKTSNTALSNAGYVALDLGQYKLAGTYFAKSWDLYKASNDKHTVAEELDLSWGLTLADYFSGDKKDAKTLYRAIKKSYPGISSMSALKQLPLVWSDNTQALINKVITDFK